AAGRTGGGRSRDRDERRHRLAEPGGGGDPRRRDGDRRAARTESRRMSIVYLIGAGPGDPGLLTVRGRECLAAADVVLYDHRVHARVLRYARPDAEKIDIGTAGSQTLQQDAIGYLMAEKTREGKSVARLKWGDPFVF